MKREDIIIICFLVLMVSAMVALWIKEEQSKKIEKDYMWLSGFNACITDVLNSKY